MKKSLIRTGIVDPELVKDYGPKALQYTNAYWGYKFAAWLKEKDVVLLLRITREYSLFPFKPGQRDLLLNTWKEVYKRTGIICLGEYYRFLKKGNKLNLIYVNLIYVNQILKQGYKKCTGDKFSHRLWMYNSNTTTWLLLIDYENVSGTIIQNRKTLRIIGGSVAIKRACQEQYNLCKRYGEQRRVDFLPIESEDVRKHIKTFL